MIEEDIINLYRNNARLQIKKAAVILGKSSQRVLYNLNKLKKESILMCPHAIIDYSYLGLLQFKIYFRGGYLSTKEKETVAAKLSLNPYISAIYNIEGDYDFCIEAIVPNPSRFNKELRTIITHVKNLPDHKITLNIVNHIYNAKTKVTKSLMNPDEYIIGGDRPQQILSGDEKKALNTIAKSPLKPYTHLAKECNLHLLTLKKIINKLQKKRILKGYGYIFNAGKKGMEKTRLLINLNSFSEEKKEEMLDFFLSDKTISYASWTIGEWNLEVEYLGKDRITIRRRIQKFRETFKDIVKNVQRIEIYDYYKKTFVPEFYESE